MFDLKFLLFISTGTLLAVAISANHTTTTTTVIGFPELEANSTGKMNWKNSNSPLTGYMGGLWESTLAVCEIPVTS